MQVALHMGIMPILNFGSAALRRRLVGPCCRGEKIICQGASARGACPQFAEPSHETDGLFSSWSPMNREFSACTSRTDESLSAPIGARGCRCRGGGGRH